MIYTLTLSPSVDYVVHLPALETGKIQRSSSEACYFSGKGINVSKILKELGVRSVALGFTAGFTGRAIEEALTAEGIAHDFCRLPSGNTRVNLKLRHDMDRETGRETETDINCQGPAIPPESFLELLGKLDVVKKDDLLMISGSVPKSLPRDAYAEILRRLAPVGARTVVDAEGELLGLSLGFHPFLVKPNSDELAGLLGISPDSEEELLGGARRLQELGARNVLVSRGERGALFLSESGEAYRIGTVKGRCVNTIGAGDSMLAGFVAGYLLFGGDFCEALRLGTAAGAASAFSEGLGTRDAIFGLLEGAPFPEAIS